MPLANYQYVDHAINEPLMKGLLPFVELQFGSRASLEEAVREYVPWQTYKAEVIFDAQAVLKVIDRSWEQVFRGYFGIRSRSVRSYVNELWDARNRCAHRGPYTPGSDFSNAEVEHILGAALLLLVAIESPEAAAVEQLKREAHHAYRDSQVEVSLLSDPPQSHNKTLSWPLTGYTEPDGFTVKPFVHQHEEGDYLQWVTEHPKQVTRSLAWSVERDSGVKTCRTYGHVLRDRGYVINAPRHPRSFEMKLHKASCGHIQGKGKNLIGKDFGMVHFTPGNVLTVRVRWIGNSRVAAAPATPELSTRI